MSSALASRWTFVDRLIQRMRFNKISGLVPEMSVLVDCGCGTGEFLRFIGHRLKKGYGIDLIIKDPGPAENTEFLQGDLNRRIPLPDSSADAITSLAIIEHLRCPDVFAKEAYRVLKKGGCCILTTPSPLSKPLLEFLAFRLRLISENDIKDHKRYFSRKDLGILFGNFREVEIKSFMLGLNTLVFLRK